MDVSPHGYDIFEAEATMLDTPKIPFGDSLVDTPSNINWIGFGFHQEEEKVKNYDNDDKSEINHHKESMWIENDSNQSQFRSFDSKLNFYFDLVSKRIKQLPPIDSKKSAWTSTINLKEDDDDEEMPLQPTRTELKYN